MDLSNLLRLANQYAFSSCENAPELPRLSIYRRHATSEIEAVVYDPVMCLILQGAKTTGNGSQQVLLQPGDALLVSHDMPVLSRITRATTEHPYVALILSLDLGLVRSLYLELGDVPLPHSLATPLCTGRAHPDWVDPLTRYLELMNNPRDAKVLGPSILREVHYRLLLSDLGGMLGRLMVAESRASLIAKAIETIRGGFRSSLSVPDLAKTAGMSVSSFHAHFKSVTGTTPLQYQKDLRLIEARAQMVEQGQSVSTAAYAVGYESPTHFSRDYSRKFGLSPSRDVKLNGVALLAAQAATA